MRLARIAPIVFTALAFATPAIAAPVTWNFSGTNNTITTGSPLSPTFSFGQSASGQLTFDTSAVDSETDSQLGFYASALTSISVTIGSYFASATGGFVDVNDDFPADAASYAAADNQGIYSGNATVTGDPVAGLVLGIINLQFLDFSALNPLSSDSLPTLSELSAFAANDAFGYIGFQDLDTGEEFIVGFSLASLTLDEGEGVPAPGALLLLGLGLLGVGATRRLRGRQSKL